MTFYKYYVLSISICSCNSKKPCMTFFNITVLIQFCSRCNCKFFKLTICVALLCNSTVFLLRNTPTSEYYFWNWNIRNTHKRNHIPPWKIGIFPERSFQIGSVSFCIFPVFLSVSFVSAVFGDDDDDDSYFTTFKIPFLSLCFIL
jgi:hypothetical protein